MSPTCSGVGSGLSLKHLCVFPALTTSQIFTAFDSWRQSQAKVLICFHERPAPRGKLLGDTGGEGRRPLGWTHGHFSTTAGPPP